MNHSPTPLQTPLLTRGNWIATLILAAGICSVSIAYALEQHKHSQVVDRIQQIDARANTQLPITTERMPDGTTRYTRCDVNGWCISSVHLVDMEPTRTTPAKEAGLNGLPRGFHTSNPEAWQSR